MTKYKVQNLRSLREEMKAVARGERPAPVGAAKPSFNSVDALGPDTRALRAGFLGFRRRISVTGN